MPDLRRWKPADVGQAIPLVRKFPTYARLVWGLLRDGRIPLQQKGLLLLLVGYIVAPIDVIPDFVPVLGQVDDVAVTLLVLDVFIRSAPKPVVDEHLARIARDEDDLRRDLEQAQRALGQNFAHLRDNLQRLLERPGGRFRSDEQAATALDEWRGRQGERDG